MSARLKWLVGIKTLIITLCIWAALSGNHPPAYAQEQVKLSTTDAVQDNQIAAINEHLRATDSRVDAHTVQINSVTLQIAEAQGEARAFLIVLGLLSSVSIVLQVRVRKPQS